MVNKLWSMFLIINQLIVIAIFSAISISDFQDSDYIAKCEANWFLVNHWEEIMKPYYSGICVGY